MKKDVLVVVVEDGNFAQDETECSVDSRPIRLFARLNTLVQRWEIHRVDLTYLLEMAKNSLALRNLRCHPSLICPDEVPCHHWVQHACEDGVALDMAEVNLAHCQFYV